MRVTFGLTCKVLAQHIQTLTCSGNSACNVKKKKGTVHKSENPEPRSYLSSPFYSICSLTNKNTWNTAKVDLVVPSKVNSVIKDNQETVASLFTTIDH